MPTKTTALPSSFPSTSQSSEALTTLLDEQLSCWLIARRKAKSGVVLAHAGTTCKVYEKGDARGVLYSVDPESKAKSAFKALAKQNLLFSVEFSSVEMADIVVAATSWSPQPMSEQDIDTFLNERKALLGRVEGRGDPISKETANRVWADAGGCCMFQGCGQDLSAVPLYNSGARIAYLAHIVASDPGGPRGSIQESHRLSDTPDNIMLMCDAHHRLIDTLAPDAFTTPRLREMRRQHASKVRAYRDAMKFPEAQVMTLFADLGGIPTHYADSEFMEVLLVEQLSMHPVVKPHLPYKGRDDRTSPDFWGNYLRTMELKINAMVQELGHLQPTDVLAVFPLHHTPTLVLAGRITGEAQRVRVFQPSRARSSWLWDMNATAHPNGTFKASGPTDAQADEVLLTVELTAHLDQNALPASLAKAVAENNMPWIRVTTDTPNGECIQRKEDLEQVVNVLRNTINAIQDKVRAKHVHLIALSPASAAFSIGQLMQVGHHAKFTLYDRANWEQPFVEAFTINGHSVVSPAGSAHPPISIR